MNIIIQSTLKTLQKAQSLLNSLSDSQLCDSSVTPYNSSIGSHIRHILDFYNCIFSSDGVVDLTARSRNKDVESKCCNAKNYLESIIVNLDHFNSDLDASVIVIDDLGLGHVEMKYTLSALFSQANSHTIHHYAIINYILEGLNIGFDDSDFGYNPTTPKKVLID
ncbi:MAG: hypothetical protein ABJL44_16860 [Algibacter sp.]